MSDLIVNTSTANFTQDVLQADKPVLVDFWAEWCQPCKMIDPTLHKLADEMKDRLKIVKINIDENPEIAQQFGIMSIPNLKFFSQGENVMGADIIGAWPEPVFRKKVEETLSQFQQM